MLVEQAIFTSAKTQQAEGYHLVARSGGVTASDARELTIWCPSHDALVDTSSQGASLNFFHLESGRYCVSRSAAVGAEYSGRRGQRIETYCLLVEKEILARFANNPKALFEAASAGGKLCQVEPPPRHLTPFSLPGRRGPFDWKVVSPLVRRFGVSAWSTLLEATIRSHTLGLVALRNQEQSEVPTLDTVMVGLLNCLPVSCRQEFTFSSGLKYSARRPFRWIAVEDDAAAQRQFARQKEAAVFDLNQPDSWRRAEPSNAIHDWVTFVSECLRHQQFEFLEQAVGELSEGASHAELSRLGNRFLGDLARSATTVKAVHETEAVDETETDSGTEVRPGAISPTESADLRTDHPHIRRRVQSSNTTATRRELPAGPASQLQNQFPEFASSFHDLDNELKSFIEDGGENADAVSRLWDTLRMSIDIGMVERVRLQYLNHVMVLWNQALTDSSDTPCSSSRALDALCLFTEAEDE